MQTKIGTAMPRNPITNIVAVAIHCVVSTEAKSSWSNQRYSVYSEAKTKKAAMRPAITVSEIARIRREVLGVAGVGAEVVVTPPS